jgi:hypothetical protein
MVVHLVMELPEFACFPNFPEDIGRTVFEFAAENGDGVSCSLVSKTVQSW